MVRCCSLTFWPCFKEERLVSGIALKWDTLVMVSIYGYSRTMCLKVTPGTEQSTEVVRPQHVDGPTKYLHRQLWRRGPFQRKERHLGFWFNIRYPYTIDRYVYTRGSTAYLPSSYSWQKHGLMTNLVEGGTRKLVCNVQYVSVHTWIIFSPSVLSECHEHYGVYGLVAFILQL